MTKRFSTGLVVGKFAPLHLGHEHVIRTALDQCERVLLISYSRPEMPHCRPERRQQWLTARFPECESLVVTPETVHAWQSEGRGISPLPDNDADDETHRSFVAQLCLHVLGTTVDAVFTSEDYGDGFAGSPHPSFWSALQQSGTPHLRGQSTHAHSRLGNRNP
jgi:HTH-type transcriptional repressor of NAD biosynthesis genes